MSRNYRLLSILLLFLLVLKSIGDDLWSQGFFSCWLTLEVSEVFWGWWGERTRERPPEEAKARQDAGGRR